MPKHRSVSTYDTRRGFALVEMLVSMTLLGALLAVVSGISAREQRFLRDAGQAVAASERMREARAVLPLDLRGLAPGDIRLDQASDTAVEFRAVIASALVCDTSGTELILAPERADSGAFASFVHGAESGDTAWLLTRTADSVRWLAVRVDAAYVGSSGTCTSALAAIPAAGARWRVRLDARASRPAVPPGTALRITRPVRYGTYRAGDAAWYVGVREWNPALARYDPVQPVAGPLASAASGFRLRYYDLAGQALAPGSPDIARVATITITLHARSRAERVDWRDVPRIGAADTGTVAIHLRNWP